MLQMPQTGQRLQWTERFIMNASGSITLGTYQSPSPQIGTSVSSQTTGSPSGTFGLVEDYLEEKFATAPCVLLPDIHQPGMSGIEGMGLIKEKYPELKIMMISIFTDPDHIFPLPLCWRHGLY